MTLSLTRNTSNKVYLETLKFFFLFFKFIVGVGYGSTY